MSEDRTSPFAGVRLTDQTPLGNSGLDRNLFIDRQPKPTRPIEGSAVIQKPGNQKTGQPAGFPAGQPAVREAVQPERPSGVQVEFDLNRRPLWKGTFLYTEEELEAIEDLKLELRRKHGVNATKNDIARVGLHSLIEDYRRHGESSTILRRLRAKLTR